MLFVFCMLVFGVVFGSLRYCCFVIVCLNSGSFLVDCWVTVVWCWFVVEVWLHYLRLFPVGL